MALKIVTPPAVEPLAVADAITNLHIKVDTADEDALLPIYIAAARRACEHETGRRLITQTLMLYLDEFPAAEIDLQVAPVQSVSSIRYADTLGVQQTISSSDYVLDSTTIPGWVLPAYGVSWPSSRAVANAIEVTFTAGYGADGSAVPEDLKLWMLLHVGHWHANRAAANDRALTALPYVSRLLDPYRILRV